MRLSHAVACSLTLIALAACENKTPTVTSDPKAPSSAKPIIKAVVLPTATSSASAPKRVHADPEAVDREIGRRFGFKNDQEQTKRPGLPPPGQEATTPKGFGLYVLSLTWAPSFCCDHQSKGQCDNLETSFGADHLTLHGLWPNYTDDESNLAGVDYPTFCGKYQPCKKRNAPDFCYPDPADIPADMSKYGPGYVTDDDFLANHEWPKHGSCSGLDDKAFFRDTIDALLKLPGDGGTPDAIRQHVGGSVKTADLQASFKAKDSVLLSCDGSCNLVQVGICLGHDDKGNPTTPVACPKNVTLSDYDNGCVTHKCAAINIQKAGQCGGGSGSNGSGASSSGAPSGGSGGKCSHPGQGPACSADAECTAQGFARCARSGCCTSIPN